ncbi:DEK1 [Symbiodinium natans]|uniref:DEK1 protein n=1 Tax=Symbiodinium natans TaxID=878477 RepID=A0A812JW76_9DINO|nr:DEK1 [Symbiodinium natans]
MPRIFNPGRGSHDFIRLVERTTNALVTKDDGALEEVKKALIQVHQQYDQVHEESEAKQLRLNRLREDIRTADQQHMNKGDWTKKVDETWNVLSEQYIDVMKRNKEALTSRKVYEHMLKRTQREQAILKQKLFQMEEHLDRKKRELQQKRTDSEQARCAKVQIHKTLESYSEEASMEREVRKSALDAIGGELDKRKDANGRRADFNSWRHEVALDAANEAFNASAGRLRKLYAIEKLSGNCLQKTTFEQVERSQTTEDNFQKIRDVTGLADVMDIVHKFLNRDVEQEQLKASVKEAEVNLEVLRQKHEKLKQEMEGLPVDHTNDPMALHKELEQAEQKLNEAIEEQEACRVRLQKTTLQSEHMKRWAARMGGVLSKFEDPAKVDSPADLPMFFRKFEVAVKKFIKRVSDQINAGKINRKVLRDFEKIENEAQKGLLSDHNFLTINCRAQAADGQGRPTSRQGAGDGAEDDPPTNFSEDREKCKNESSNQRLQRHLRPKSRMESSGRAQAAGFVFLRVEASRTRGLAGLEPVTTELSLPEWMMLSRLLELDVEEADSSFEHWEIKKSNEFCKACQNKFMPDAKFCRNCGQKRPKLAELKADRSGKVALAAFLDEHGIKQSDHDSLDHVQEMLVLARQKLANGESYLDHSTSSALPVAVSQVLWGLSQQRKPAECCWEVVDDGTVVLSTAGRKAIERLRSQPNDLVEKVKQANIQPPLLPSHAGRQGNRENCVSSVQTIIEKCNKEGTKYTDPRWNVGADPAKVLYVDAQQPGYDCTVAKPAGYKRLTEIIDEPVLFKGGVRPADIIQGQIGTCFFLGVRLPVGVALVHCGTLLHPSFLSLEHLGLAFSVELAVFGIYKALPCFAFAGVGRASHVSLEQRTRSSAPAADRLLSSRPAMPVGIEEVAATPAMESMGLMGLVLVAGQAISGLAALYAIMSFAEYVYHRYFQHLGLNKVDAVRAVRSTFNLSTFRGDGHVEHHRETIDDDMSLDVEHGRDPILDMDPWRGTCFPWDGSLKMSAGVMLMAYPTLSFLGWSGYVIVPVVLSAMLLHALVWNALHPNMHGLEDVPLEVGAPSWVLAGLRDSALFKYLRVNHEGHHRANGAHGNYNVCCPGVDQVVGTTVDCVTGAPLPKPAPDWLTLLVAVAAAPLMPAMAPPGLDMGESKKVPQYAGMCPHVDEQDASTRISEALGSRSCHCNLSWCVAVAMRFMLVDSDHGCLVASPAEGSDRTFHFDRGLVELQRRAGLALPRHWVQWLQHPVGEDPENVRSCFMEHDIDVGVYGVRFFLDGEWYHTIIDDWMPVDQYGRMLYAKSYDHDEVWVPLLEKAFCKLHTCYEMCDGGQPGEAVSVLFGGAMGKFKIKEKTRYKPLAANVYYETLHDAHEAGWVLSTTFTKSRAAGGKAGQGKCGEGITNDGLVHGHVYSVLRVVEACGNKLVCCRNPWGQGEWKGKWSDANAFGEWTPEMKEATNYRGGDDGTFWMSIEDFLATSGGVHYSRTLGCKWKQLSQYSYFQTGKMQATALWTYKARADDEIGFWKGDQIQVARIAPGWWSGTAAGSSKSGANLAGQGSDMFASRCRPGFFPGNYVKLDDREHLQRCVDKAVYISCTCTKLSDLQVLSPALTLIALRNKTPRTPCVGLGRLDLHAQRSWCESSLGVCRVEDSCGTTLGKQDGLNYKDCVTCCWAVGLLTLDILQQTQKLWDGQLAERILSQEGKLREVLDRRIFTARKLWQEQATLIFQ